MRRRMISTWFFVCACAAPTVAQDHAAATPGRAAAILNWAETRMDAGAIAPDGLYPELGGFIAGSGISIGPRG